MEFLNEYMLPVIMGICLMVGYVIKHWIKDADNKIIPTVCAIVGVVVAFWLRWGDITPQVVPEIILSGLASGLASTGLHQAFKQFIDNGKSKKDGE